MSQINKQSLYFAQLPRKYINLGVSAHMGTMGVLWASGGGQKSQKTSKNHQKSKEIEKNMSELIIKVRFLADSTVMGRTWELGSIWGP